MASNSATDWTQAAQTAIPEGWRDVSCALCGADGDEVQVGDRDRSNTPIRMVVCRRCGLVYENPAMTEEGLARYY